MDHPVHPVLAFLHGDLSGRYVLCADRLNLTLDGERRDRFALRISVALLADHLEGRLLDRGGLLPQRHG